MQEMDLEPKMVEASCQDTKTPNRATSRSGEIYSQTADNGNGNGYENEKRAGHMICDIPCAYSQQLSGTHNSYHLLPD